MVQIANRKIPPQACKEVGIHTQLRDECLNGEIFYSLKEAQVVIEQGRKEYNTRRSHSALGYRVCVKTRYLRQGMTSVMP